MNKRNYGIDLLKSVSMLLIVVLHILGVGGILAAAQPGSAAYGAAWYLETLALCAVNCFGLASGYVLCRGHYRYSRIFSLWVRVVCEILAVTVVFSIFAPQGTVTRDSWVAAVSPVLHNVYWYFTAYFILFFFVPYLNKMLLALSGAERTGLCLCIVVLGTLLDNLSQNDIIGLHGGYCFLWLTALYLLGACIRLAELDDARVDRRVYLAAYFVFALCAWGLMLLFGGNQRFVSYTSPFILAQAAALLLYFRRLPIDPEKKHTALSMFSRTSFGVYIIHTAPLIWGYILTNRFVSYLDRPVPVMLALVLLTAAAIYLLCTLGDWLVEKLLKLLRVELLEHKIDLWAGRAGEKLQKAAENR